MKDEHMLMYALVFVLGFVVSRMIGGRLIEGLPAPEQPEWCTSDSDCTDDNSSCDKSVSKLRKWGRSLAWAMHII
jgi:hypothetical protein